MASLKTKLSFIFLCDGPCTSSSWKDEDVSMYWARRDALIRISIMSLWQGPGILSLASDDCSLLFHETISVGGTALKDELLAVMTMSGPHLVSKLPIPNESSLMREWKEAATVATKFPQRAEIGSVPVTIDKVLISNCLVLLLVVLALTYSVSEHCWCLRRAIIIDYY